MLVLRTEVRRWLVDTKWNHICATDEMLKVGFAGGQIMLLPRTECWTMALRPRLVALSWGQVFCTLRLKKMVEMSHVLTKNQGIPYETEAHMGVGVWCPVKLASPPKCGFQRATAWGKGGGNAYNLKMWDIGFLGNFHTMWNRWDACHCEGRLLWNSHDRCEMQTGVLAMHYDVSKWLRNEAQINKNFYGRRTQVEFGFNGPNEKW